MGFPPRARSTPRRPAAAPCSNGRAAAFGPARSPGPAAPDPEGRTLTLLACFDGLVLDALVRGDRDVPREAVELLVAAALRS
ncbi:hypothetical protein ACIQBJ_03135 [Kitasatospora sp. NPDC088391]|uniref:hypothetical protein n=1 Tax=Kitasatospora sp. NPDC088391 TaxID=3364074 RepID=UPI00380F6CE7